MDFFMHLFALIYSQRQQKPQQDLVVSCGEHHVHSQTMLLVFNLFGVAHHQNTH